MTTDWLPNSRAAREAMALSWLQQVSKNMERFGVSQERIDELGNKYNDFKNVSTIPTGERTKAWSAQMKAVDDAMVENMRDMKKRFFYSPPLTDADFVLLGLKIRDTEPTAVGNPVGQATADISYPSAGQLELRIKHVEGTPFDVKANYGFKIFYGVYAMTDAQPADGTELKENMFTRQKKTLFTFTPKDSGKKAYFSIRYENGKGVRGSWGPMISAIIP